MTLRELIKTTTTEATIQTGPEAEPVRLTPNLMAIHGDKEVKKLSVVSNTLVIRLGESSTGYFLGPCGCVK